MKTTAGLPALAGLLGLAIHLVAAGPAAAQRPFDCDGVAGAATPLPDGVPAGPPEPMPYHRLTWQDTALNLGIGHLRPTEAEPFATDWFHEALIPLFPGPRGAQWGWIARGWLVHLDEDGPEAAPLGTRGMIETGYETPSFIVLGQTDDGWLEFRWGAESAARGGTAWLHRCHLSYVGLPLRFQTWAELFREENTGPMFFRSPVRHSLRAGPGTEQERLGWIAGEGYHLEPVEVDGEWMRVRVKQPSDFCQDPSEVSTRIGWIKWRSPDRGPWIWYYTRGC